MPAPPKTPQARTQQRSGFSVRVWSLRSKAPEHGHSLARNHQLLRADVAHLAALSDFSPYSRREQCLSRGMRRSLFLLIIIRVVRSARIPRCERLLGPNRRFSRNPGPGFVEIPPNSRRRAQCGGRRDRPGRAFTAILRMQRGSARGCLCSRLEAAARGRLPRSQA